MDKLDYAAVIRSARKAAGLSQEVLAARVGVSRNAVTGWETGHARPDLDVIPALCQALSLSPARFFGLRESASTARERKAMDLFSSLEPGDQQVILWQMEGLYRSRREQLLRDIRSRLIPIFKSDLSAAAGYGSPLDEASGETVYLLRDSETEQADEVITVSGHSMEPTFQDGDLVLVRHAKELRPGELGVFLVNNEGYIKEYQKDGLHSHNPAYGVMSFNEFQEVRCIGKVLGKVRPDQLPSPRQLRLIEEANR